MSEPNGDKSLENDAIDEENPISAQSKEASKEEDTHAESDDAMFRSTISSIPDGDVGSIDINPNAIDPKKTIIDSPGEDVGSRVGTRVGKYQITKVLGQGGMGVVYAAVDPFIGRDVAIKFLSKKASDSDTALKRFVQEARAVGQLQNPNVVSLFDVNLTEDGTWYLVMELITGGTAGDLLDRKKVIDWKRATRIVADACRGLAAAHAKGFVHRDIKPDNLMLTEDGTAKISDFGLAKAQYSETPTLTQQNQVLGTPHYMSPEQCRGWTVDGRSDIYSLGATYFDLLTGRPPYSTSSDVMQIMYAQCHEPTPDPNTLNEDLPPLCRGIVEQAMVKEPDGRYQTADEMLADLLILLDGDEDSRESLLSSQRLAKLSESSQGKLSTVTEAEKVSHGRRNLIIGGMLGMLTLAVALTPFLMPHGDDPEDKASDGNAQAPPVFGDEPPVRIGILHSLSGSMSVSESGVVDAILLAVEEINQKGGVLGRRVEAVVADGRSDDAVFRSEAERLITEVEVVTLFGCWTSSSRKQVKEVVEQHNHLLFYPVQFEGMELSPNIIYTGAAPNQQIIPAVRWAFAFRKRRRFYIIGSDYVFPRAASEVIKDELKEMGVEPIGETFVPLGHDEFAEIAATIAESEADVILNLLNGQSNISFFHALRAAGVKSADVPTFSFSIAEPELRSLNVEKMVGDYAAWSYFHDVDTPENQDFVAKFQKKYNPTRLISDPMQTGYMSLFLWAQAVKQAGNFEPTAIRDAVRGQTLLAPEGEVTIDPKTQYTEKPSRIGQINESGRFEIVVASQGSHEPEPFPDSRTPEAWREFLKALQSGWNGGWSAPTE